MRGVDWIGFVTVALLVGCGSPGEQQAEEQLSAEDIGAEAGESAEGTSKGTAVDADWVVDFSSYGPVPLGVGFEEANAAAGGALEPPASHEGCDNARLVNGRDDVWFMVIGGQLKRVDIYNADIATRRGARIGDSEDRIRDLYPEGLDVQPHKYIDGHYLIISPAGDDQHRLIFETDGTQVQNYRAGVLPEVAWVEGCA